MSPQSTAKRIHGQVGDSCLQHDTLRFGLFSFSCPRLRCVRPTEAMAGPYRAGDRAHGPHRHARSAPSFAAQGRAAGEVTPMQIVRRQIRANVSKVKRRETARAIDGGRRNVRVAGMGRARRRAVRPCTMPTIRLRSPAPGRACKVERTRRACVCPGRSAPQSAPDACAPSETGWISATARRSTAAKRTITRRGARRFRAAEHDATDRAPRVARVAQTR